MLRQVLPFKGTPQVFPGCSTAQIVPRLVLGGVSWVTLVLVSSTQDLPGYLNY